MKRHFQNPFQPQALRIAGNDEYFRFGHLPPFRVLNMALDHHPDNFPRRPRKTEGPAETPQNLLLSLDRDFHHNFGQLLLKLRHFYE